MFHFNPKISIEVCPHHSQVTPLYGDGFTVSRSGGSRVRHDIHLQLDAFLSNIAHADATLCTYPPRVALIRHQLPLGFDVKGRCDIPPKRSDSDIATLGTMLNRRFAPPWSIEDIGTVM